MKTGYIYLAGIVLFNTFLCLAQSWPENTKINLTFKNQKLGQVLLKIQDDYHVRIAFAQDVAKLRVSGNFVNESLVKAFDQLAAENGLEYKVVGGQVVFKKKGDTVPRQKIKGEVHDEQSGAGLPGAVIRIISPGDSYGVQADSAGAFFFPDLPVGQYEFQASYVGYTSRIIGNVFLGSGKEVFFSIGLTEAVSELEEIVVSGYRNKVVPLNQMAVVSARSVSDEEAQRFAGSLGDPARMALSYAGVTSSNGYNNEIIVRGNSPRGLLWRLEGIEVPNPNHYAVEGSSGGFINILNSNNMARSDFFVSAFPAEIGNASSGIFDLRMRKGNAQKREHTLEVATLGLRASTEGPAGKSGGSYLVNYRYSMLGLIKKLNPESDNPEFQDMTFKINLPSGQKGNLSFFGLSGTGKWQEESQVSFPGEKGEEIFKTFYDIQRYDLAILGAKHTYSFKNQKTFMDHVLGVSVTRNRPSASGFNYERLEPYIQEQGKYINNGCRYAGTIHHKISARHLVSSGVKGSLLAFKLYSETGSPEGTLIPTLNQSGQAVLLQGFVSWQWKPSVSWVINTGAHITHFSLHPEVIPEPRLGIEYNINSKQSLSIGAGLHSRHESLATYYGETVADGQILHPNKGLKLSKAGHAVLGYNLALTSNLHLKLETYMQYQFDVPVEDSALSTYSSLNQDVSFTTRALVNKGEGKNYGVELTLEKNYARFYYFLLTGSLFEAKYKAMDGIWRDTRYNTKYAFNLIGGKEFRLGHRKNNTSLLGINVRAAFSGGKRVTPLDLEKSVTKGVGVEISELAFSRQLSSYYRLDFSMYYKWEAKKTSHQVKLDILNLLERNIYGIRFEQAKFGRPARIREYAFNQEDDERLNIYPVFSYKIDF